MQGTHTKNTLFSLINSSLAKHGLNLLKVHHDVNWATQPVQNRCRPCPRKKTLGLYDEESRGVGGKTTGYGNIQPTHLEKKLWGA